MSHERNKSKVYSLEFKESSAKLAVDSEHSIAQTARNLGLKETTLYGWVSKYGNMPKKAINPKVDADQELQRLRKENTRLKQERDILKKAAAYFASEVS